jgi:flagellar motor switch/type III secretory pathway protein FliN
MMNHFDVLPSLKYPYFEPASIRLINVLAQTPVMFELNHNTMTLNAGLGFDGSSWIIVVTFNTGEGTFSLYLPQNLFIDFMGDFKSAQTWPVELLNIRVQHFLEPVMHLFEQGFKKEIVVEGVNIHKNLSSSNYRYATYLNLQISDQSYDFALEAQDSILSEFVDRLNAAREIIPLKGQFNYSVQTKLSIGSSRLSLQLIKNINIHDIILVEKENFKGGVCQLICADQWLEAHSVDLKIFSIIKKLDGRSMKKESDKSLIETSEIELNVDFICGHKQIPISELEAVNPGYVFELNQDISSLVSIEVNGAKIGEGRLVEVDNRLGVQVVALAKGQSALNNSGAVEEVKVASV